MRSLALMTLVLTTAGTLCGCAPTPSGGAFAVTIGAPCPNAEGVVTCGMVGAQSVRVVCSGAVWTHVQTCSGGTVCQVLSAAETVCVALGNGGRNTDTAAVPEGDITMDSHQDDGSVGDAGTPDTGSPDTGTPDAGSPDTGSPDTGTPDAGSPDTGTPDAGSPDTGSPDTGTPDAGSPDTGSPDTGTPDAGSPDTQSGCSCVGKPCGFIPGCPKSCGACGAGWQCINNQCKLKSNNKPKSFGEFCGATPGCQPPPSNASPNSVAAQVFADCKNAQCATNLCYDGVCTKTCTLSGDSVDNATGAQGADGIADMAGSSGCGGAASGKAAVHGSVYACVDQGTAGSPMAVCQPAGSWKHCTASSQCVGGEQCRLYFVKGKLSSRCGPASHSPGKAAGVSTGQFCNSNAVTGPLATCTNDMCFSVGCSAFCQSDVDCGSWKCIKQELSSSDPTPYSVCWPKSCQVQSDCPAGSSCKLSYNGVSSAKGDPDPNNPNKILLPGWSNLCVSSNPDGVNTGQVCDPFVNDADQSLKTCKHPGLCNNGMCSQLCTSTAGCPKNMKCYFNEAPLDLDTPNDGFYDVFLPYGACTNMKGASGTCVGSKSCGVGKHCKVVVEPAPATTPVVPYAYVANGICVDKTPGMGDYGELCGSASTGVGLGKLCNSGFCLNTTSDSGKSQPGFCVDLCSSKNDCPQKVSIYNQNYKSICTSLRLGWNTTAHPEDDHFIPVCVPTNPNSSLTDCTATKACPKINEACLGFAITMSVDKPAKVEYLCSSIANSASQTNPNPPQPIKNVGDVCSLDATLTECKAGYCMPDVATGKGYCSRVCNKSTDCPTGLFCNQDYQRVPRPNKANAAFMPMCMKAKSCIPCSYDYSCAGSYACTNIGGVGTLAKQVCAPKCVTNQDCAATDGGSVCVPVKDADGQTVPGKKVCAPSC